LIKAWGSYSDTLDPNLLLKTREALSYIRRVYRFKGELGAETPARIDYRIPRNRAGYLAAFGERHAYLSYAHLKMVHQLNPEMIPLPYKKGELSITLVGAGPAIETYGLCLFYNEFEHRIKHLTINLIEKVTEWKPLIDIVVSGLIRSVLPIVIIYQEPIDADIKDGHCVQTFAAHHDSLTNTNILLIYSVLNEIESEYAPAVLRNLSYIIRQCEEPLLILLAEPVAKKAWPRIKWIRNLLLEHSTVIQDQPNETIEFNSDPIKISLNGVNELLFGQQFDKNPPKLETKLNRVLMACKMIPTEPFSRERYDQLQRMVTKFRRDQKGKRLKDTPESENEYQLKLIK
jgi:hypothetical protein